MTAWIPTTIYSICLFASAVCAVLLVRGYVRSRTKLLLWSAICFLFLALNNLLVVIDVLIFPVDIDLYEIRQITTLIGVMILIYAFIWEVD